MNTLRWQSIRLWNFWIFNSTRPAIWLHLWLIWVSSRRSPDKGATGYSFSSHTLRFLQIMKVKYRNRYFIFEDLKWNKKTFSPLLSLKYEILELGLFIRHWILAKKSPDEPDIQRNSKSEKHHEGISEGLREKGKIEFRSNPRTGGYLALWSWLAE